MLGLRLQAKQTSWFEWNFSLSTLIYNQSVKQNIHLQVT